ncbi:MAG: hypothetical protein OXC84_15000 [Gammaproteobacteria bacterium]|nr:hypothetical protein [Gammaproteobacteria bacterium]
MKPPRLTGPDTRSRAALCQSRMFDQVPRIDTVPDSRYEVRLLNNLEVAWQGSEITLHVFAAGHEVDLIRGKTEAAPKQTEYLHVSGLQCWCNSLFYRANKVGCQGRIRIAQLIYSIMNHEPSRAEKTNLEYNKTEQFNLGIEKNI